MEKNYCAIDFETACPARASACAVGAARIRGGVVTDTFYSLIKPPEGMDILPFFTSIHKITPDDVADAPGFEELWPDLKTFLGNDVLVAHNAPFDRGVLAALLEHYCLPDKLPPFECSCQIARKRWPSLPNHKLNTVSRSLGIALDHHEALSDAVACARIFISSGFGVQGGSIQ